MSNELGRFGEYLFSVMISRLYGRGAPLFRPHFLGDQWPLVDFFVELITDGPATPYFFAQVKGTRAGYTKQDHNLKVQFSETDMNRLAVYPAPTYIVGIDERREEGYLLSANGECRQSVPSLPTLFPLNKTTQDALWHEVTEFWATADLRRRASGFVAPNWR